MAVTAHALESPYPYEGASFAIEHANDMFVGDDSDYTSGVSISWMSGTTDSSEDFASILGTVIGGTYASQQWRQVMGMGNSANLRQQWGLDLTQNIFTPDDKSTLPLYGQHPYVGHLALTLSSLVKNEDRANLLEFQLGVTGSASLAKGAQHFIHKVRGMEQWPGWGNQMPSELTFNLNFRRYYRLRNLESDHTDALFYWHAEAGTVKTQAGLGITWRIGQNMGDCCPDLTHYGSTIARPFASNQGYYTTGLGYYFFVTAGVRAVAHDLYLDGTVFHSYPKYVDKMPFVGQLGYGVGLRYEKAELIFGLYHTSKEYHGQSFGECTGALQLRYTF